MFNPKFPYHVRHTSGSTGDSLYFEKDLTAASYLRENT
jgi:hypothetical protein